MHLDTFLSAPGPNVPDLHLEDLSEQEVYNLGAYVHAALNSAIQEDLDGEVIAVLREWYDEIYVMVLEDSPEYRERVLGGFVFFPGDSSDRARYLELARRASES